MPANSRRAECRAKCITAAELCKALVFHRAPVFHTRDFGGCTRWTQREFTEFTEITQRQQNFESNWNRPTRDLTSPMESDLQQFALRSLAYSMCSDAKKVGSSIVKILNNSVRRVIRSKSFGEKSW